MKYKLSKFTKVLKNNNETFIFNTISGNKSYVYDEAILKQIK